MKTVLIVLLLNALTIGSSYAQTKRQGLFDVELRRTALAQPAFTSVRAACLAIPRDPAWSSLKPVESLKATEGYGTDGAANSYAWAVMVLTGRTLAGDAVSETSLRDLLLAWAKAKAFANTEVEHDAYYALKRVLRPTVVAYSVLRRGLDERQKRELFEWI
ncbi:MAG: alginate lyase, partial [Microvirga sp.]|nr:alginate lyase [Microvirga sp.]